MAKHIVDESLPHFLGDCLTVGTLRRFLNSRDIPDDTKLAVNSSVNQVVWEVRAIHLRKAKVRSQNPYVYTLVDDGSEKVLVIG